MFAFDPGEFLCLLDWIATPEGAMPQILRLEDGCGGCSGEEEAGGTEEAEEEDCCGGDEG